MERRGPVQQPDRDQHRRTMKSRPLIYGANGYTGEMIARAAAGKGIRRCWRVERKRPLRPSRRSSAANLGYSIFWIPRERSRGLAGCSLVIHCAGPFSATAAPMMAACLAARVHYTDITGEIDVFEHAFGQDAAARAAGSPRLSRVGFDVVPTDCVALALAKALPGATHLALGFDSRSGLEPGNRRNERRRPRPREPRAGERRNPAHPARFALAPDRFRRRPETRDRDTLG